MSTRTNEPTESWPMFRLEDVAEIASGITLGRAMGDAATRPVPYLRVANVKDGRLDLSEIKSVEATEREIEKLTLKPGDVLLTEGGDPDKLGRGTFWEAQLPECIHQNHIFRVRFSPDRICHEFAAYQFGSAYGKAYFAAHAKQTTGIACINRTVLGGFPFRLPPLAEQRRLAGELREKLAAVAEARAALQSQIKAAAALPAAYLREVFEGDAAAAGQWELVRLGELAPDSGQYGLSVQATREPKGLPMLRMGNIHEGRVVMDDLKFVELEPAEAAKYLLKKGDLLFNRTNSAELVGKTAVYEQDQPAVFASYIIRFVMNPRRACPRFVAYFINSPTGRVFIEANMARAIGQVNISASTMRELPIPLPPLPEQRAIAARLDGLLSGVADLRSALEARLASLERLPGALLREVFDQGDN